MTTDPASPFLPDSEIEVVATGDLATLATLDERGLILGRDETAAAFAERLRRLRANFAELEQTLTSTGKFETGGLVLRAGDRISPELYAEANTVTRRLYAFAADWVPGFYVNPRNAWLFGGCAFFDCPDFFALFIIRKIFAVKTRWFIYNRRELLAHELCHVARVALYSGPYEERFAYQTAETGFRRHMGSVFRTQYDSFLLLGSTILLLVAQVLQIALWQRFPVWVFWLGVIGAVLYLGIRHARTGMEFARARRVLTPRFGDHAMAVLFRCTDAEIGALARLRTPQELDSWVSTECASQLRWRVIQHRFALAAGAAASSAAAPDPGPGCP